jgi:hypothetical protein
VPALVKVKLKLLPGGTDELKVPWFDVTVWVTLSWFVQVTLVPTLTVRLFGLNEKFIIETLLVAGVGVGVGFAVGVAVGAVVGAVVGVGVGFAVRVAVGVAVGAVVGVGVGFAVRVAVGAVVGVVPVPVVAGAPPQAARSTSKPTASRHSQACVVVGVDGFFMSLPLLQGYCMNTAEDFLSPSNNTLPGYTTHQLRLMTACVQMLPIAEIKNRGEFASGGGQAFSRFSPS